MAHWPAPSSASTVSTAAAWAIQETEEDVPSFGGKSSEACLYLGKDV